MTGFRRGGERGAEPEAIPVLVRPHPKPRPPRRTRRPPQFVVVSFDGSGGPQLWSYWRSVGRRAHARFTFFVSGVYLLADTRRGLYHPPRHAAGSSDIWFARAEGRQSARAVVRATLRQMAAGYREGHEIGTHFNGHFCEPYAGNVGEWTAADWSHELDQFDRLVFHANANNGIRPAVQLPFGPEEVVGDRTPCLQGRLGVLYPVLARGGFRYDASRTAPLGQWPTRRLGIWSVPLAEIPFVGHTFRVVSMDYNFLANQVDESPDTIERETYMSLQHAFRVSYRGNRAPLSLGFHFETWESRAYVHALTRFLIANCRRPGVRCVPIRDLVDWLDEHRLKRR
jgi:hypothetical protein